MDDDGQGIGQGDTVVPVLRYGGLPGEDSQTLALRRAYSPSRVRPVPLVLIWIASIWIVFPAVQFGLGFLLPGAWYDVYLFCYSLFAGPTYAVGWWLAFRYRLNAWGMLVPIAVSAIPTVLGFLWAFFSRAFSWGGPWGYFGDLGYYFWTTSYRVISLGAFAVPLWLYSRGTVTYLGSKEEDAAPKQLGVIHLMVASLVFAILLATSRVFFSSFAGITVMGEAGLVQVAAFASGLFLSLTWILATWVYVSPKVWKVVVALTIDVGVALGLSFLYSILYPDNGTPIPRILPEWLADTLNTMISFGSILLTFYVIEQHGYQLRTSPKGQTLDQPAEMSEKVEPNEPSDAIFAD
ncbi:MAG: hypothetical protein ACE361_03315 [Aureliella sp.]